MSVDDQRNLNRLNIPIQKQRSAKADRCDSSTGTIKLLTERPMCERDCTIRQHPLYFLLTFWLKLGKE